MSNQNNKDMIDALSLWGRVCGKQSNCETCAVGAMRGANVTCQDFARQFPEKFLSLLTEMDKEDYTYYNEYCVRFPECNLPIETLSSACCRKAVFEGYLGCGETMSCVECWNQRYTGDYTGAAETEEHNKISEEEEIENSISTLLG